LDGGQTEKIGWTDCDESVSLGASLKMTSWGRPDDVIALGGVVEGLSPAVFARSTWYTHNLGKSPVLMGLISQGSMTRQSAIFPIAHWSIMRALGRHALADLPHALSKELSADASGPHLLLDRRPDLGSHSTPSLPTFPDTISRAPVVHPRSIALTSSSRRMRAYIFIALSRL
jgi:hypothetical protein